MKKTGLTFWAVMLMCGTITFSSCIGSFNLTNKLLSWNKTVGSKFANELVFFCFWVVPIYEVSIIADVLVLNSIEFWSGSNPVAVKHQAAKRIKSDKGNYLVQQNKDGYTITNEDKQVTVNLRFEEESQTWFAETNGKSVRFMKFLDENHVRMYLQDGQSEDVELSRSGVVAFEELVKHDNAFFAYR